MSRNLGIVIPVGTGRRDNLRIVLKSIIDQDPYLPIYIVADGDEAYSELTNDALLPEYEAVNAVIIKCKKHKPGLEPPRNFGARILKEMHPQAEWVWFVDSDVYLGSGSTEAVSEQIKGSKRIICGYYNWLDESGNQAMEDYRIDMFREFTPEKVLEYHLGAALANFSGNLVWPLDEFQKVGGFHPGLSAGRVDDGELGVRAATYGIGTSFLIKNKGHHIHHTVNLSRVHKINKEEVPLINKWHPYIQELGIVPRDLDGKRFNFICECGEEVNTLEMWSHYLSHDKKPNLKLPKKICENTGLHKPNCSCASCLSEIFETYAPQDIIDKYWAQDA